VAETRASVIIPAHNEAAVLGRLLTSLIPPAGSEGDYSAADFDVIVVCNGCTDNTAEIARSYRAVTVLETATPSKQLALRLGDTRTNGFPRIYLDADVEIGHQDITRLVCGLATNVLAVSPRRVIPYDGVSLPVRWYYDIWQALPNVRAAIFGRGVICLSEAGFSRISGLPMLMSDDLAMSAAFTAAERSVVDDAVVVVRPPKVWADLIRRRVRAVTGTRQAYASGETWSSDSRTGKSDLIAVVRERPALLWRLPFFLAATVQARRGAARALARGEQEKWLRDNSSRQG
jgi:hypothetical protein